MLARLPRPIAILVAILLGTVVVWCFTAPTQTLVKAAPGGYTDMQLYRDIVARMDRGENYYAAATAQQRLERYPTRPFVTVRLPTLYWLASKLGWSALATIEIALLLANAVIWPLAMPPPINRMERIAIGVAVLVGGLACASPGLTGMSEAWCGLMVALASALTLWRKGPWWLPALCMAAILPIRELALGFVILSAVIALAERRRRDLLVWLTIAALFAAGMVFHALAVSAHVLPGDRISPGWAGGLGLRGMLQALVGTTLLQQLARGPAMALAFIPVLGWLALEWRGARFVLACIGGYALAIALFSRSDNFYWGFLLLPMWFVGMALVPRGAGQLFGAITRR